jgi:hypothetical protein
MNSKSRQKKSILAALNEFFDRKTIKGFANRIAAIEDLDLPRQEAFCPLLGPGGPPRLPARSPNRLTGFCKFNRTQLTSE